MAVLLVAIIGIGLLLAYANGANDNFKGVATLLGSGTASYRAALIWATVTTALVPLATTVHSTAKTPTESDPLDNEANGVALTFSMAVCRAAERSVIRSASVICLTT